MVKEFKRKNEILWNHPHNGHSGMVDEVAEAHRIHMLMGNDDCPNLSRILVVGDLALRIWTEILHLPRIRTLPPLLEFEHQRLRIIDWNRKVVGRRIALCIPEHHALVSCAVPVNAHRNVRRLSVDVTADGQVIAVETIEVIPNVPDNPTHKAVNIHICMRRDLTCEKHRVRRHHRLDCDSAVAVLPQALVQHGV